MSNLIIAMSVLFGLGCLFIFIGRKRKLGVKAGILVCIAAGALTLLMPFRAQWDVKEANEKIAEEKAKESQYDIDIGELAVHYPDSEFRKYWTVAKNLKPGQNYELTVNLYASDGQGNKKYKITHFKGKFKATTNEDFNVFYELDEKRMYSEKYFLEHEIKEV